MGKLISSGVDNAAVVVSGSFTGVAASGSGVRQLDSALVVASFQGEFNLNLYWTAFVGTVQLERSFDGGTTYQAISKDLAGTALSFTGVGTAFAFSAKLTEPERGVIYRWNCTAYTSGTAVYRLSI